MMRIGLFLLTNLAILVVSSIVFMVLSQVFGLGSVHGAGGLNYVSLAVMVLLYGMIGSMISLFLSKWMAKKSTGTVVIDTPRAASSMTKMHIISRWTSSKPSKPSWLWPPAGA